MTQAPEAPITPRPPQTLAELLAERTHARPNIRRKITKSPEQAAKPWFIIAAAVMILTATTGILIFNNPDATQVAQATSLASRQPANPPVPDEPPSQLTPTRYHGTWHGNASPNIELPVQVAKGNLTQISESILTQQKPPAPDSVQLQEILNHFPLHFTGTAAITPHPQRQPSHPHLAILTSETTPCPWKPSATLLLIALRASPDTNCEIKLAFHAHPENVFRYRLLGSSTTHSAASAQAPFPSQLAANSTTLIALEIEPSGPNQELGTLVWSANASPAPPICVHHHAAAEPSDDARFAALVCTFAQWLAEDPSGTIDAEIVAALAREISTESLPNDRADFLNLVARAIKL